LWLRLQMRLGAWWASGPHWRLWLVAVAGAVLLLFRG
jgi:hypothetical protein